MAEPTLQQVFGAGATQDANTLTISKSALTAKGLQANGENSAEALLVAIVMLANDALSETSRATDLENRTVTVVYSGQDLISQGGKTFQRDAFSVLLYKETQYAAINPNDY